jgi:hypothetical protein
MNQPKSKLTSVRTFKKASSPYSAAKLGGALLTASRERTDSEFAVFQIAWMQKHIPEFCADAFSVIFCQMDSNQMIAGARNSVFMNMRASELDVYRRVQHLDVIRPTIMRNIGTGIFNTDFYTLDAWREQPMYQSYYEPLGLLHTVSIAYEIPFKTDLRLQFTYFKSIESEFASTLTKDEVEYLSIPFYYIWALRWGIIDEITCARWLNLMTALNPTQLFLLRDLITRPRYSLPVTAEKFGINPRMVNHFYNQIYSGILSQLETNYNIDGNASKMVDLAQAFSFLHFIGDYRPKR